MASEKLKRKIKNIIEIDGYKFEKPYKFKIQEWMVAKMGDPLIPHYRNAYRKYLIYGRKKNLSYPFNI